MFASFCSCLFASFIYSLYALGCLLSTFFLNIFCVFIYQKKKFKDTLKNKVSLQLPIRALRPSIVLKNPSIPLQPTNAT